MIPPLILPFCLPIHKMSHTHLSAVCPEKKKKILFVSFLQYKEQQESFKSLPPTEAASMIQCKVIKTRAHENQQAWGCVKITVCIQWCPQKIPTNKSHTLGTAVSPTFLSGLWKPLHTPPKSGLKLAPKGHRGSLHLSALCTTICCN